MSHLRFEWDPRKDAAKRRKHGVSFTEAETSFSDENALFLHDPDHSADEDRFLLLGLFISATVGHLPHIPGGR